MLAASSSQPDRPGLDALGSQDRVFPQIRRQTCPDRGFALRITDQQRIVAVSRTDGAAEDDETLRGQRIHESCVLVPAVLLPPQSRMIPIRARDVLDQEVIGHVVSLRGRQYSTRSRYRPHGGAVRPASLRAPLSSSGAMRSGGSATIVPTSVRTMCLRKLSAVISNTSASPWRCHAAAVTFRRNVWCCVSVGVNARKSCPPTRSSAATARRSSSIGRVYHQERCCSNGDDSRRRQMR